MIDGTYNRHKKGREIDQLQICVGFSPVACYDIVLCTACADSTKVIGDRSRTGQLRTTQDKSGDCVRPAGGSEARTGWHGDPL